MQDVGADLGTEVGLNVLPFEAGFLIGDLGLLDFVEFAP